MGRTASGTWRRCWRVRGCAAVSPLRLPRTRRATVCGSPMASPSRSRTASVRPAWPNSLLCITMNDPARADRRFVDKRGGCQGGCHEETRNCRSCRFLAGSVEAANAQDWRGGGWGYHGGYYRHGGWGGGGAVAAGLIGGAILGGLITAAATPAYGYGYADPAYGYGYYGPGPGYYYPRPAYYYPRRAYYAPRYYYPRRAYYGPRVYPRRAYYAPRYYGGYRGYYGPRYLGPRVAYRRYY